MFAHLKQSMLIFLWFWDWCHWGKAEARAGSMSLEAAGQSLVLLSPCSWRCPAFFLVPLPPHVPVTVLSVLTAPSACLYDSSSFCVLRCSAQYETWVNLDNPVPKLTSNIIHNINQKWVIFQNKIISKSLCKQNAHGKQLFKPRATKSSGSLLYKIALFRR